MLWQTNRLVLSVQLIDNTPGVSSVLLWTFDGLVALSAEGLPLPNARAQALAAIAADTVSPTQITTTHAGDVAIGNPWTLEQAPPTLTCPDGAFIPDQVGVVAPP